MTNLYALGSVMIGALLVVDNLLLMRRGGAFEADARGQAKGWTFVFMYLELAWAGTSAYVLWQGYPRPALPIAYLLVTGLALLEGFANRKNGLVLALPLTLVRANVAVGAAFTAFAIYEAVALVYKT
jgi:hypothetical protein